MPFHQNNTKHTVQRPITMVTHTLQYVTSKPKQSERGQQAPCTYHHLGVAIYHDDADKPMDLWSQVLPLRDRESPQTSTTSRNGTHYKTISLWEPITNQYGDHSEHLWPFNQHSKPGCGNLRRMNTTVVQNASGRSTRAANLGVLRNPHDR